MPAAPRSTTAIGLPVAALVGFAVGVLVTFKAPAGFADGVPYGFALGLLLASVLVAAFRLGLRGRRFGAAAALGLLAAALVLALPSAGGSVVVPLDATGAGWLLGPGWPVGVAIAGAVGVLVPLPRSAPRADGILGSDEGT